MEKHFAYPPEEADRAVDETLALLRGILLGSTGFALTVVVNDHMSGMVAHCAGGKCSTEQLAKLCTETLIFSKKMAERPGFVECGCPECRSSADT